MASVTTDLIINVQDSTLSGLLILGGDGQVTNGNAKVPKFARNDGAQLSLRFVKPDTTGLHQFADVNPAAATVRAAIGSFDAVPFGGTFYLKVGSTLNGATVPTSTLVVGKRYLIKTFVSGDSFTNVGASSNATGQIFIATGATASVWSNFSILQEITPDLAYNATAAVLQAALNNTHALFNAVAVTKQSEGYYYVSWISAGAQTLLDSNASSLIPQAVITIAHSQTGSDSLNEVQSVQLVQNVYALQTTWTAMDSAAATIAQVQTGTASLPSIQSVTLSPAPYSGIWSLTIGGTTYTNLGYAISATDLQTKLGGNYVVTKPASNVWQIAWVAVGAQSAITADATALVVPVGVRGSLNLNTTGLAQAFSNTSKQTLQLQLEVEMQFGGSDPQTVLSIPVIVNRDVINPATTQPVDLSGTGSPAAIGIDKDVWIVLRTDNITGTGTLSDPYDGTGTKYDSVMAGIVAGTHIHLGPGTFQTDVSNGVGAIVRNNWVVEGSGRYVTTVQMIGNMAGYHFNCEAFKTDPTFSTDNVVIKALTIDCNSALLTPTADIGAGGEANYKSGGILIAGSNNTIEDVMVINAFGSLANEQESFSIGLIAPNSGDAYNNWIINTEVRTPAGNHGAPWALFGFPNIMHGSGVVGSRAFGLNDGLNTIFDTGGLNAANLHNCTVRDCYTEDCSGIFYTDSGSVDGLYVTGNTVIRGWQCFAPLGALFSKTNLWVVNNVFEIQNRVPGQSSYGMILQTTVDIACNGVFAHNRIKIRSDGNGAVDFHPIYSQGFTNSTFVWNICDAGGLSLMADYTAHVQAPGNVLFHNQTPDGFGLVAFGGTSLADTGGANERQTSVVGALRIAGTCTSTGGEFSYEILNSGYDIVSGDRLQLEVYCSPSNPQNAPLAKIDGSTGVNSLTDQNGLLGYGDVSTFAKDKWYFRDFDLTDIAGHTNTGIILGCPTNPAGGDNTPTGDYIFYYRNIQIVSSAGAIQHAFYTPEKLATPSFGIETNFSPTSVFPNFGGNPTGSAPTSLAVYASGYDGSGTHFLADDRTFKSTGVGQGNVSSLSASSVDQYIAVFAGTTGKNIKNVGLNLAGGLTGTSLIKNSNANFDWSWAATNGGNGGGSVNSFFAGTLSPIFTTSVAAATTNPNLSFALTNVAAHRFLGNNIAGPPSYVQVLSSDISGLAASATTDTTNASLITSGKLGTLRLPNPAAGALGGVRSYAQVDSQWIYSISTSGIPASSQPTIDDILNLPIDTVTSVAYAATVTPAVGTLGAKTTYNIGAMTGSLALAAPTGTPVDGQILSFRIIQSAAGSAITFASGANAYAFGTDITTALVPGGSGFSGSSASAKFELSFKWNSTDSRWRATGLVRGF